MFNINMSANIKKKRSFHKQLILSIMAGIAISLGCIGLAFVKSDSPMFTSLSGIMGGFIFSFGLFCIFGVGFELFTTNCLMSASMFYGKLDLRSLIKILSITLLGNFIGCLAMWLIFYMSGFSYISALEAMANAKTDIPLFFMFIRGILCNIVLCYAGLIQMGDNGIVEKFITAVMAVIVFVACGFEHSIADIFILFFENHSGLFNVLSTLLSVLMGNLVGGLFVGWLYSEARTSYDTELWG